MWKLGLRLRNSQKRNKYINEIFVAVWFEIHSFYTVLVVAVQYFATRFGQTKKQKQAEIFFPALNNNRLITVFTVRFSTRVHIGGGGGATRDHADGWVYWLSIQID
jgi:hypothetical protein